jgi:hypothetical protein
MPTFTRREILAVGVAAALAACSKSGSPKASASGKTLSQIVAGRQQTAQIVTVSEETLVRPNERVPFALFVPNSSTQARYTGGTANVWIAETETSPAMGPYVAAWHDQGLEDKGIYSVRMPIPNVKSLLLLVEGHPTSGQTVLGGTTIAVGRQSQQPIPGEHSISVPTPTVSNHRAVNPICTASPQCSMHDVSLDTALAGGKPTVLIISTPRFCTSRTCGPVTDIVDSVKHQASSNGINFVHIEVYANDTDAPAKQLLSPAANAWKLSAEPATYFIGKDGVILERFIGAAAQDEIAQQVSALKG